MSLTITLQNDLARRFESEALRRQITVEDLGTTILDRAVTPSQNEWSEQNQRRLTLIRQSIRQSLTDTEQQELEALQVALDMRFADFDAALKSQLALMQSSVQ